MAEGAPLTRRCATHDMSIADRGRMAALESSFLESVPTDYSQMTTTIKVAFIHVVEGGEGTITQQQREAQIQVMNDAFQPIGIDFVYDEAEVRVVDDAAYFRMGHDSLRERNCKSENQIIDPQFGLNFYTARPGGGLLGWARFPYQMEGDPDMDGVVMLDSTLPGSVGGEPYNLGFTGVHEIGHWLGLYHTFQDGCSGLGDEVSDTAAHDGPNFGKPLDDDQPHNLCPGEPEGSLCPIHNYMNYVDDDWMNEFTPGQRDRIWAQIGMFRTGLLPPAEDENGLEAAVMQAGAAVVW